MNKSEYQVVMLRIQGIEQEQLHCLDYVCKYLEHNIDVQQENVHERILQLFEEKGRLQNYIK